MRLTLAAVVLVGAVATTIQGATPAAAELRGPAVPPPADYTGTRYVDQDGCLYLRAGSGASALWVPILDDQHKPVCGLTPTSAGNADNATAASAAASTSAAPPVELSPADVSPVALAPAGASLPAPAPAPAPQTTGASLPGGSSYSKNTSPGLLISGYRSAVIDGNPVSCNDSAPVLEKVMLRSGMTALVCTRGDGSLFGWQVPYFSAAPIDTRATPDNMQGARRLGPVVPAPSDLAAAPAGWTPAWGATSAPVPAAASTAEFYVQVGAYRVPAHATAASAKVTAMGMTAQARPGGPADRLLVISAGPFASWSAAKAALSQVVAAGYSDAFIR